MTQFICLDPADNVVVLTAPTEANSGAMLSDGVPPEAMGRDIYDLLLHVASGKNSKSEARGLGDHEFVPWRIRATM